LVQNKLRKETEDMQKQSRRTWPESNAKSSKATLKQDAYDEVKTAHKRLRDSTQTRPARGLKVDHSAFRRRHHKVWLLTVDCTVVPEGIRKLGN
jgi:hypothetical protein